MKRYYDKNLKTSNNYCDIIDENFMIEIPDDGKPYDVINNKVVDISNTEQYKNSQRLKQIEIELIQADLDYETYLNTPVKYSANNKYYKPKYAQDSYIYLLTAGTMIPETFPVIIWDSSELESNAVKMTAVELTNLTKYLAVLQQLAFNTRKIIKSALLLEKNILISE